MAYKGKKVSVVIPTYNESQSIRGVVDGFFETGLVDEVVVVDNNALGNTREEVAKTRARLVHESKQGYGHALMRGLLEAKGDLVVMCEADGTAEPGDIMKFLLYSEHFPVVLSTRTSRAAIFSGAFMPFPVRVGNWLWAKVVEVLFNGPSMSDIGSTYKLINRKNIEKIKKYFVLSDGDGKFSPEFIMWVIHAGVMPIEIPVLFKPRIGESMYTGSIWRAAKLGFRELWMIFKYRLGIINMDLLQRRERVFFNPSLIVFAFTFLLTLANFYFSSLRFSTDDQFILLRYIDNLASGNGFVYNVGERVLGATTPLFVLIAGLLKYFFSSVPTHNLVAFLNLVLISLAGGLFWRLARFYLSERLSILAVVIFALNMFKVLSEGMESPLFILILLGFFNLILSRKYSWSAVAVGLLVLTRPDAVLVALVAFVYWWSVLGWRQALRLGILSIIITLPWLVFATLYFGSFIPQSVITKLNTANIVAQPAIQALKVQLAHMSRLYWGKIFDFKNILLQTVFNLLPFLILAYLGIKRMINRESWPIFVVPTFYFLLFSFSNPVMFPWYLSQIEPVLILVSVVGFGALISWFRNKYIQLIFVLILVVGPAVFWFKQASLRDVKNEGGIETAQVIKKLMKEGETIGVNNIGGIGYITKAPIIDFFGLTNDYASSFYPAVGLCVDKQRQYSIPPNLIMFTTPDWLVLGGEGELDPCFMKSRWFTEHYKPLTIKDEKSVLIWRLKK